jgi:tetratricopeptide (TPR) repeat protein
MNKSLISIVLASMLLGGTVYAKVDENKILSSKKIAKKAITDAKHNANIQKDEVKIVKEAVEAVALTKDVLVAIDKKDKDSAIKTLQNAIGKLEVVMSNPKAPALIPLDSYVSIHQFVGGAKDANIAVIESVALLSANKIQEARMIVSKLQDEIDFTTINLPLASYPAALKLAAKYLQEDKLDEAKSVLIKALSTFTEITTVTPIGLIEAHDLVLAASKIATKDKNQALMYLDMAKASLKKAEALGYTSVSDTTYKMLNQAIANIEKKLKGKNKAEKLFDDLIAKLKEFKDKAINSIQK